MSLGVKLDHVRGPIPPGEKLARVTFRGVSRVSRIFLHTGDYAVINQLLEYPIARAINGDEKVDIQILAHNKFLSNRVISGVSFSLHRLLDESCIQLAASLLDSTDKPTKSVLHLVVWYSGPGQHDNTDSLEEDSQALINLERNIANLERSLSASQLLQTSQNGSNQSLNTAGRDNVMSARTKYHTAQETFKRRNISLKTVKNALSFSRRRSGGSEEQNLLGSSQELADRTDRDTEDETGAESQDETERGLIRLRDRERDSLGSGLSDNLSSAPPAVGKRKSKRSNK